MKKLLALLVLLVFAATTGAPPANATPFVPAGFGPDSDRQGISIEDMPDGPEGTSIISKQIHFTTANPETPENPYLCKSLTSNGCKLDGSMNMSVTSILPFCEVGMNNCVEGLSITKADGQVVTAKFSKAVAGITFDGVPEKQLPGGATPSIWTAEGAPNEAGSEKYVVNVSLGWHFRNSKFYFAGMNAQVIPVKELTGNQFTPSQILYETNSNTKKFVSHLGGGEPGGLSKCAATDVGYCAEKVGFASGARAELNLRITNKVTGWLHGRVSQASISVIPINSNYNNLRIAGSAVEVPTMYAEYERSKMTPKFMSYFREEFAGAGTYKAGWIRFSSSLRKSLDVVKTLAASAKDTASGTISSWRVKSIPVDLSNNKCLKDTSRLVGLVTTNALAYSGSAPRFSAGFLKYEVAGLHYMPDGKTLTEGTYDLAIRSDVARCLYGFSKAPISAVINVVSESGERKVATTIVNESAGWLNLRAAGFTFSSPTISVKLTQPKASKKTQ